MAAVGDTDNVHAHRILAEAGGVLAGVASACVVEEIPGETGLTPPIGWVRLVAVAPSFRRRGIASLLVRETCEACVRMGAAEFVSYAWVYCRTGIASLSATMLR